MTPQPKKANPVTRTVFDLASFGDVKLIKDFTPPTTVTSVEEALAAVGNDTSALLAVINEGLEQKARDAAYDNIEGFKIVGEDGTPGEQYTGKYADESKSKLINAAVLNLAKMFSGGAWDSATKEQKSGWRNQAEEMLRSNPAMLASIQG